MERYGRITGGVFEFAPVTFITPEGKTICNFNRRPAKMVLYGFKPVRGTMPDYGDQEPPEPSYVDRGDYIEEVWPEPEGGEE